MTLWDVGAERQAQLRGPDALSFADYLSPRDLLDLAVGRCRFTPVCDPRGQVMADCIVLRPFEDTVWYSHSDCDISLWAYGLALARGARVEVEEADVAPLQLQGPLAATVLEPLYDGDLARAAPLRLRRGGRRRGAVRRLEHRLEQGGGLRDLSARLGALPGAVGCDRRRAASRTGCSSPAPTSRAPSSRASPTRSTG